MFLYIINGIALSIFLVSYFQDRRKLSNGFWFMIALFLSLVSIVYAALTTENTILLFFAGMIIAIGILIVFFGLFIMMIISFIEARILIKKEGGKKGNLWSLFLGIGILLWSVINSVYFLKSTSVTWVSFLMWVVNSVGIYLLVMFIIFMMSSFVYAIYRPRLRQDYIIVLGAGLLHGEQVTPLLAKRIDRAIRLYKKQLHKKKKPLFFIMSGGKGPDEKITEAHAMKEYALTKGVAKEHILVEEESKTTYENMLFSKRIIDQRRNNKKVRVIFSTTNYHVFRAGIYAKRVGLKAQGMGARTPFYFWYNAMLREFIAILFMYRRGQIYSLIGILLVDGLGFYFINHVEQFKNILQFLGIL